ncbi:hypothetical protein THERMOT_844 [Bathymodiolus thermophilus thioautotrophic gill symbiont]|uniref:hypothetical protein n=1 Tax=Bathymodiolus thermophilus thioautotrophic gill symbiont TaxID=2360 RepID=UPI00192C5922|nr:hypothetical protein [Bathymodiolus thermophilus thioautotrophic gill symbiont]CAB5498323.1 hypothetical protein THERMOT_844 [Bathymodiolus thermophilus thioautotrophic gill symbiont]
MKNKFIKFIAIIFIVSIAGCFTAPINNKDFQKIRKIEDLNGTYLNKGDTGDEIGVHLSRVVWANDRLLNHKLISEIVIKALNSNELQVEAMQGQSIVKKQIFIKGKDFNIDSGKINLRSGFSIINDIVIGVEYHDITVGIDTLGNGKYVNSGAAIGIAILIIPFAIYTVQHVRFVKIK